MKDWKVFVLVVLVLIVLAKNPALIDTIFTGLANVVNSI